MSQRMIIKVCAVVILLSGIVILFSTAYPLVSYEWESAKRYPTLISPLVDEKTATFKLSEKDYTRASNWFDDGSSDYSNVAGSISYFTITIPKLYIESATVAIGGDDLSENLIQYPGTAVPGREGNTVVFGHSVLPAFFDPENYLSIFSTLPTMEEGDEVYVDYDGISYKYRVEDMFEVKASDLQILAQNEGDSYLSLITCTPPGHPLKPKRLIVRTKLVPMNKASVVR
jgi:sortase A